ncbi:MAG: PilZ domain-containing protein [Deltaproteobacteria bacterium]|nr:PilZ domain-containing protein [Deltaproteobacteria bacterium]
MSGNSERRDGARLDLQLRVRFESSAGGPEGEGEATDVSPRGARLECRSELKEGTRLTFTLDAGDGRGVKGHASVSWCRPRHTPGGKTVYDVGVRFDDDWLKGERGPLGRALGRFFAATESEPARDFTRVRTSLQAEGKGPDRTVPLTVVDLSEGGLRVTADGPTLPGGIQVGRTVRVTFGQGGRTKVDARVAWVAESQGKQGGVNAQFGVAFARSDAAARDAVMAIVATLRNRDETPPSITLEVV